MNNHEEKQVGSNLTGSAIPGKPGHERDVPIDQNAKDAQKNKGEHPAEHIENTDALLGDVHQAGSHKNSLEDDELEEENGS